MIDNREQIGNILRMMRKLLSRLAVLLPTEESDRNDSLRQLTVLVEVVQNHYVDVTGLKIGDTVYLTEEGRLRCYKIALHDLPLEVADLALRERLVLLQLPVAGDLVGWFDYSWVRDTPF